MGRRYASSHKPGYRPSSPWLCMAGIPREAVFGRGLVRPRRVSFRRFPCFQLFSRAVGMRKEILVNVRFPASLAGILLAHLCYAEEAPQVTPEVVVTATRFWEPAQELPVGVTII